MLTSVVKSQNLIWEIEYPVSYCNKAAPTQITCLNCLRCMQIEFSMMSCQDGKLMQQIPSNVIAATIIQNQPAEGRIPDATVPATSKAEPASDARNQWPMEVKEKKRTMNSGRAKGSMIMPKGRGPSGSGWTGAGFDVDSGT